MPRLKYTEEDWYVLEKYFPGIPEYIEQIVFNLIILGFRDPFINKTKSGRSRPKDRQYIKYNINASHKLLTIYICQNTNECKLKFWKPLEIQTHMMDIRNEEELKKHLDEWFDKITKGEIK